MGVENGGTGKDSKTWDQELRGRCHLQGREAMADGHGL